MFLYGMNVMGDGLAKTAGGKLEKILEKLTSTPIKGVLLGAAVTGVIQSSSATTSYGGWTCKLRHHEAETGSGYHHGCKYRNNSNIMDTQPYRNTE